MSQEAENTPQLAGPADMPRAVAEEWRKLKQRAKEIVKPGQLLIGGKWVPSVSGKTFAAYNPATREQLSEVADGQAEDIDRAVQAAREANVASR